MLTFAWQNNQLLFSTHTRGSIMKPSIDGLCQFVQTLLLADSPIFANLFCVLVQLAKAFLVLGMWLYVCAWKVVNLVSIYHWYEHFCTIFCFPLFIAFIFVSVCLNLFFLLCFSYQTATRFRFIRTHKLYSTCPL